MPRMIAIQTVYITIGLLERREIIWTHFLSLSDSFHLTAVKICTLCHKHQKSWQMYSASPERIHKSLIRGTHSTSVSHFTPPASSNPASNAHDHVDNGNALRTKAERALLDWIPIKSHSCWFRLNGPVHAKSEKVKRQFFFVVCVCPHTSHNSTG